MATAVAGSVRLVRPPPLIERPESLWKIRVFSLIEGESGCGYRSLRIQNGPTAIRPDCP